MFNSPPEQQRRCATEIIRFIEEGVLRPIVGRAFPLEAAAKSQSFFEENRTKGAGTLTGKIVITID